MVLEPLGADATGALIAQLCRRRWRSAAERILEAADGNPLFSRRWSRCSRGRRATPSRGAADDPGAARGAARPARHGRRGVLAARRGEGQVFHRAACGRSRPRRRSRRRLPRVRKSSCGRTSQITGDDAFRFRHLLIRDAAYDALPKAARAELHERFAMAGGARRGNSWSSTRSSATMSSRPPATGSSWDRPDETLAVRARERLRRNGEAHPGSARGFAAGRAVILDRAVALLRKTARTTRISTRPRRRTLLRRSGLAKSRVG